MHILRPLQQWQSRDGLAVLVASITPALVTLLKSTVQQDIPRAIQDIPAGSGILWLGW